MRLEARAAMALAASPLKRMPPSAMTGTSASWQTLAACETAPKPDDGETTDTTDTTDTTTTDTGGGSPYTGGWDIGDCQDDVVAGAWSPGAIGPGSVLPDWYLTDSYGDMISVRDFCHNAIYFDYSALW